VKQCLVGGHENEVVWRVGDDITLCGRILSYCARRVAEPTKTEAKDAVGSQRERKQFTVQSAVLQTYDKMHEAKPKM